MVRVPISLPYIPLKTTSPPQPKSNFKVPLVAALAVFLLIIGVFGFNLFRFKQHAENTAPIIYDHFKQGADALLAFDLAGAKESFQAASRELQTLNSQAPIKNLPKILNDLFSLSQNTVHLSGTLEELKANGLSLMINKKGAFLIEHFKSLTDDLSKIGELTDNLKSQAAGLGYQLGEEFSLPTGDLSKGDKPDSKIEESENFLKAFIGWLEQSKKQRLLILFQNPSEIRPAGGFIGSYGIATLFQGNLLDLEVRDIYDPDGQLDINVIPPKPLQGITGRWGARDANWFFDFPTSAKKVSDFLESSKIYKETGVKFAGAVAVNVEVIKDLLEIIGPIDLPEYNLTINKDNFLAEVQREVEAGADKAKNDPKKILKVLTPLIFDRLAKPIEKDSFIEKMGDRFRKKDIMVYFKDGAIEDYLKRLGVGGEVAVLPENFNGEYLAVVNANIAGGKSDAFIKQKIKLEAKVDKLGQIENHLTIERNHNGQNEKDWWYRATNRNYLQVFVTPNSKLLKISGDTPKIIKPLLDYRGKNYITDESLKAIEQSDALVFGKTSFARWLDVKAGTTGKLELNYLSPNKINLVGGAYHLIFEKQSGVNGELDVIVEAPEGFQWKESGSRIFNYSGRDLPARVFLDLTLEEDPAL